MSIVQLGPEPMPYVWAKFFWFIARPMKPEEELYSISQPGAA